MKQTILIAAALLLMTGSAFGAAQIEIIIANGPGVGFNDTTPASPIGGNHGATVGEQRLIAFRYAAEIWGAKLDSRVPIRISAQFINQTCTASSATLGSAGAAYRIRNFGGGTPNTWYSAALANKIAGVDLVPGLHDINANFNALLNGSPTCLGGRGWYYGLDGNEGNNIDFVAVLLHEMGHGLGFQTFTNLASGNFPASGGVASSDPYANHLMNATTSKTYPQMTSAERVAASVNSGNLVWTGARVASNVPTTLLGVPALLVHSPASVAGSYAAGTASFGPPLNAAGVTGTVVLGVDTADAAGPSTTDGCSPFVNGGDVIGNIALVDRGACGFAVKVKNAQDAGAIGVIVADNVSGPVAGMGGADSTITIPSLRITLADGNAVKAALPVSATLGLDPSVRAGAHPLLQLARMFAPNPAQSGSSVSHYDTSAFPNQLMEPSINADLTHNVEPPYDLTLPLFRDIGWYLDRDLDLVDDEGVDQCLGSDLRPTINIGSCNSGVDSAFSSATGCTRTDLISRLAAAARNHGDFVSSVAALANGWKSSGAITGKEYSSVVSCAAGSDQP